MAALGFSLPRKCADGYRLTVIMWRQPEKSCGRCDSSPVEDMMLGLEDGIGSYVAFGLDNCEVRTTATVQVI